MIFEIKPEWLKPLFGILIKYSEIKSYVQSKILQRNCRYARSMTNSDYMMKTGAMLIYRQQRIPSEFCIALISIEETVIRKHIGQYYSVGYQKMRSAKADNCQSNVRRF